MKSHYHDLGYKVFSYNTCIWQRGPDGTRYLNTTKYSRTTSKHQSRCRASHPHDITVDNVPINTGDLEQWLLAKEIDALDADG